jgi:hypothetical protein
MGWDSMSSEDGGGGTASGGTTASGTTASGGTASGGTASGGTKAVTGAGGAVDVGAADVGVDDQMAVAIRRLRAAGERFVVQLRRDEGFDSEALDELCEAIDTCGRRWAGSAVVPMTAALILAELFPAIDDCARLYPDPMQQRIRDAAGRVSHCVSASLDTPDGGLDPGL